MSHDSDETDDLDLGHRELAHPEVGYYAIGAKSYGRAPNFLLATGYEQARSVVAEIAGDGVAAREVRLVLPETGVCSAPAVARASSCCGGGGPDSPHGEKFDPSVSDTRPECLGAVGRRGVGLVGVLEPGAQAALLAPHPQAEAHGDERQHTGAHGDPLNP